MVTKITSKDYKDKIAKGISVIDFSATWCGPCQMLAPIIEGVSELDKYAGKVNFYNIDTDESPDVAAENGIQSVPTVIVYKDGEVLTKQIGFVPAEVLEEFIDSNL